MLSGFRNISIRPVDNANLAQTFFTPVGISQLPWEMWHMLSIYRDLKPRSVLEIGTLVGGTLYHWMKNALPGGRFVTVDLSPAQPCWTDWAAEFGHELHSVIADSRSEETLARAKEMLQEDLDFLFIDGDHSYETVKGDFVRYGPLVRKGGIIALHDIVSGSEELVGQVPRFWQEIRAAGHVTRELLVNPDQGGWGIGVVYLD